VTLGDLAGLPLLMNAPCPHCEQISTRGSDAAVSDMPAVGADDSGEHERDYRRSGRGRKRSSLAQQLRLLPAVVVPDDQASVRPLDGPGRWKAALRHGVNDEAAN
jgi:hypothetical protein